MSELQNLIFFIIFIIGLPIAFSIGIFSLDFCTLKTEPQNKPSARSKVGTMEAIGGAPCFHWLSFPNW